ncbi:hypothetical protein QYE76_005098 [Lolium multiflorum]|uniref:Uncharacterized protein n=1 Tax=Lolium multiflorum TaxID=4521 RepID=A0AAD8W2T7_LOLMU|nr:hypothetical protein QYE76_005098 [Lolium multiflorum]
MGLAAASLKFSVSWLSVIGFRDGESFAGGSQGGGGMRAPHHGARRVGPAPPYGVGPSCLHRPCPSAYLNSSDGATVRRLAINNLSLSGILRAAPSPISPSPLPLHALHTCTTNPSPFSQECTPCRRARLTAHRRNVWLWRVRRSMDGRGPSSRIKTRAEEDGIVARRRKKWKNLRLLAWLQRARPIPLSFPKKITLPQILRLPPADDGRVDSTAQLPSVFSERLKPLMDQFIRLGSQSIGFRNEANILKASLQRAEERAEALEAKLKLGEEDREKAQVDAASVEELCQRLSKVESALSDKIAEQIGRNDERFELLAPKDDRLQRSFHP